MQSNDPAQSKFKAARDRNYWCSLIALNFDTVCGYMHESPIDCAKLEAQADPDAATKRFAEVYRTTNAALPTFENFGFIIALSHDVMKKGQVDASLLNEVGQRAEKDWKSAQPYYVPPIEIEGACPLPQAPLEQAVSAFKAAHELMVLLGEKIQPDGRLDLSPSLRRYLKTIVAGYSPYYDNAGPFPALER